MPCFWWYIEDMERSKKDAFSSCSSLNDITIPGSMYAIGCGAFANCFNNGVSGSVVIPEGVVTIEDDISSTAFI